MPSFGDASKKALAAAHPDLQKVLVEAIKEYDFKILDSTRGRKAQEEAVRKGNSKARFGDSAHNWTPAIAVDIVPYPVDWNDLGRFRALAKIVLRIAAEKGVPLRWGADWDRDGSEADEKGLRDFPHFELHPWREYAKKSKLFGE